MLFAFSQFRDNESKLARYEGVAEGIGDLIFVAQSIAKYYGDGFEYLRQLSLVFRGALGIENDRLFVGVSEVHRRQDVNWVLRGPSDLSRSATARLDAGAHGHPCRWGDFERRRNPGESCAAIPVHAPLPTRPPNFAPQGLRFM